MKRITIEDDQTGRRTTIVLTQADPDVIPEVVSIEVTTITGRGLPPALIASLVPAFTVPGLGHGNGRAARPVRLPDDEERREAQLRDLPPNGRPSTVSVHP